MTADERERIAILETTIDNVLEDVHKLTKFMEDIKEEKSQVIGAAHGVKFLLILLGTGIGLFLSWFDRIRALFTATH